MGPQFHYLLSAYLFYYWLYHEVEVSSWFIHQGPLAQGCVNCAEINTEWYNRLVPWAIWPRQRIYNLASTALAIKGSSTCMYLVIVQSSSNARHRWLWANAVFCPTLYSIILGIQNHEYYCHCVEEASYTAAVSISIRSSHLQLLFFQLLTRHSIALPTINPVH